MERSNLADSIFGDFCLCLRNTHASTDSGTHTHVDTRKHKCSRDWGVITMARLQKGCKTLLTVWNAEPGFNLLDKKRRQEPLFGPLRRIFFIKLGFNRQSFMEPKGTGTNRAELGLLNWNKTVNTCTKLQKNGFSTINILKSTLVPPEPWLWRH